MITMNSCSGEAESTCFMVKPAPITDLKIHFLLTLKNTPSVWFSPKVEIWTVIYYCEQWGTGRSPQTF